MEDIIKRDQDMYQRMTNMAIRYQTVRTWEEKRSLDEEVKDLLWKKEKDRFQKFWVYYLIRRED